MQNNLEKAYNIAQNADVTTPPDSVVLYSVSFLETDENKRQALQYIKENAGTYTLDNTECGKKLIALGLDSCNGIPDPEIMKVWAIASRRFIWSASGNITAFVYNADKRSTFVSIELPNILQNPQILKINGIDKYKFAEQFK